MYLMKKDISSYAEIPMEYGQEFLYDYRSKSSGYAILKKINDKEFGGQAVEIAKFLIDYNFATDIQLYELFRKENETFEEFGEHLNDLALHRIINGFYLTKDKKRAPEYNNKPVRDWNRVVVYVVDYAGVIVLENYTLSPKVLDWIPSMNFSSSERVANYLMVVEFYLSVLRTNPKGFMYFEPRPQLRMKERRNLYPDFEIAIERPHDTPLYIIGRIYTKNTVYSQFRTELNKWNEYYNTNFWRKYHGGSAATTKPLFILYGDNLRELIRVAPDLEGVAEIPNDLYRLTTEELIKQNLGNSEVFLRYIPEDNQLEWRRNTNFETPESD